MSRVECDVLVVGSGAGGFMTALAADEAGLDVILTEKASVYGGTSALSGESPGCRSIRAPRPKATPAKRR